jgi:hypothetical protein
MIDWVKLNPLYERKSYRIVQRHIKKILTRIPIDNATLRDYKLLIELNITHEQIYKMFLEIYKTIGLDYGNRVYKELEKTKKANILLNEQLLKEILLFLSNEGGVKIVTVRNTLIEDLIKAIQTSLGENGTIVDLRNAIYESVTKNQAYKKWMALRIARTETTFAAGFTAMKTAEQSDLVLQKEWISVLDNRTRRDHKIVDGTIVDFDSPFIMASGASLQYPGDTKAPANEVINCRCTIAFVPKRDANGMLILKQ